MNTGVHRAKCIGAVLSETREGREKVILKFARSEDKNDTITWDGFFGDNIDKGGKTLTQRTVDAMRCCGWEGDDLMDLEGCKRNEVEIVVIADEYQGVTRNKVRYVQPVGTAAAFMPEGLPPTRAAAFAQRMKARIRGEQPNYGSNPIDRGRTPGADDDIEF